MGTGSLSDHFVGVAARRLTPHQVDPLVSRGHEFQGSKALQSFLGSPHGKERLRTTYLWLADDQDAEVLEDTATWYDARANDPTRSSEPRLLYTAAAEAIVYRAKPGDTMFIALKPDRSLVIALCAATSAVEQQLMWLFGVAPDVSGFKPKDKSELAGVEIGLSARIVLEQLGVEIDIGDEWLDRIIAKFGEDFPDTCSFSAFARESVADADLVADPDGVLTAWLDREEVLFLTLERHLISRRLKAGFERDGEIDVDSFLTFSTSVRQRRMSRAGNSLERHLEALFTQRGVQFQSRVTTEGAKRPDFLFPSQKAYLDPSYPTDRLTVLGAKRTCKDRWRQVLSEGDRVTTKHLITIEPGISPAQTDEMRSSNLQLVVPESVHETYLASQRHWLMSLQAFIDLVEGRQPPTP